MLAINRRNCLRIASLLSAGLASRWVLASTASAQRPVTHQVKIDQAAFHPANLTVRAGDTVQWINEDIVPHTATAIDAKWDTQILQRGQSKAIKFATAGRFAYLCQLHPSMTGEIHVN